MKRKPPIYKDCIAWIALNDNDGSKERLDLDLLEQSMTVLLLADVFGIPERSVALDVIIFRVQSDCKGRKI